MRDALMTLLAAPVTVLVTMMVGYVVLTALRVPVHAGEMAVGACVNVVGGLLAAIAVVTKLKKGTAGIVQAEHWSPAWQPSGSTG